jgi:hypothetical protein
MAGRSTKIYMHVYTERKKEREKERRKSRNEKEIDAANGLQLMQGRGPQHNCCKAESESGLHLGSAEERRIQNPRKEAAPVAFRELFCCRVSGAVCGPGWLSWGGVFPVFSDLFGVLGPR